MLEVIVDEHFLVDSSGLGVRPFVAQRELDVVDAVRQREALQVNKAEVQFVEAAHRRAVEVVFLEIGYRVLLPDHNGHLNRATVDTRRLLGEVHRPGVNLQIGLHIGAVLLRQVEG